MGHRKDCKKPEMVQWGLGNTLPLTDDPENPIKPFAVYKEDDDDEDDKKKSKK